MPVYNPHNRTKVPDILFYENPQVGAFYYLLMFSTMPQYLKKLFPLKHQFHFLLIRAMDLLKGTAVEMILTFTRNKVSQNVLPVNDYLTDLDTVWSLQDKIYFANIVGYLAI